jgi:hypothetical protein
MSQKDAVLAMRNAMFVVGDGMSLDDFMIASITAQVKMATETANTQEQAAEIIAHYLNIAIDAVPHYWSERSSITTVGEDRP